MRTTRRYNSKVLGNIRTVLVKHVNSNLKDYLILSIVFVIGVMAGVVLINNSNEQSKSEINGYINGFVDTIKDKHYEVDKVKLTKISIIENMKIVILMWIAGSTIIGIPLIYVITAYKGFRIGYTISAIISCLGMGKRNVVFNCFALLTEYNSNSNYTNVECKCFETI